VLSQKPDSASGEVMPIVYTWEGITHAYEKMYEQMKDAENETGRNYASHAEGMLKLIPRIRNLPEFKNFDLDMSMGHLRCKSKSGAGWVWLAYAPGLYGMEIYEKEAGYSGVKGYDSEQIIPALQAELRRFPSI
jgi:hypothetical protein